MDINHNWPQVCTQLIGEMSNEMMWMGLMMFGVGICLGIFLGIMFQKDENGELS